MDSGKTQLAAEAIAETASAVSTILQLLNMRSEWQSPSPRAFQPHSHLKENHSHGSMVGTSELRVFFARTRELLAICLPGYCGVFALQLGAKFNSQAPLGLLSVALL